jgi:phosphate transport system substrate-binding protein
MNAELRTRRLLLSALCTIPLLASCAKSEATPSKPGTEATSAPAKSEGGPITLQGSGASFPAPLYSRWFKEFSDKNPGIRVNYQATGSGAGIKAFMAGQTDFGASDAAMTDAEIKEANDNVVLFPVTAGSIVLAYNLEGVSDLKLTREAYVGIFQGKITTWSDPKIAASNPGVKLPAKKITTVHRSDGSGTTFVFTQHLAAIDEGWKKGPGSGTSIEWPGGVAGKKNDGVTALITQTPGSIGYIEYGFAISSKQPMAALENKAGKFVAPTLASATEALKGVELPADMRAWVTDPVGDGVYPIVTYTWLLTKKKYDDAAKGEAIRKLLRWCLTDGQKLSETLQYAALPASVVERVASAVERVK